MHESMLSDVMEMARSGRKADARRLLLTVLKADRTDETAWLWFAECAETLEDRCQALKTCLLINPGARRAQASLARECTGQTVEALTQLSDDLLPFLQEDAMPLLTPVTGLTNEAQIDLGKTLPMRIARTMGDRAAVIDAAEASEMEKSRIHAMTSQLTAEANETPAVPLRTMPRGPQVHDLIDGNEAIVEDEWVVAETANVFTVPLDAVTSQEFNEIAERTEVFISAKPDINPLNISRAPAVKRRPTEMSRSSWADVESRPAGMRVATRPRKVVEEKSMREKVFAYLAVGALMVMLVLVLAVGVAIILKGG